MRKISLGLLAAFFKIISAYAQQDSNAYQSRKLEVEEVNFVSGYYTQDGNNSAVTGGIGTEKLTDFANTIELKLVAKNKREATHNISVEVGVDAYSSASSDKIDPGTVTSASYSDKRIYPTLSYGYTNAKKDVILGGNLSYSTEYDYKSYGAGINAAKLSADKNREISLKLQAYFDTWTIIYPIELRPPGDRFSGHDGATSPRTSLSGSLSFSQVVNKRLQIAFLLDGIYQQGLLATRYQRVYFTDLSVQVENLPESRFKIPIGLRANYFLGDRFVFRAFYRYYMDNWGIDAHTIDGELAVKINPYLSVSPFYRFYTQTAADYFAPYAAHALNDQFYTSDYDLAGISSHFFGTGMRYMPEKGVFHINHWAMAELRYGHYVRSNGLTSDIISLNARF